MKINLKQMPDDGASAVDRRVMRHTPGRGELSDKTLARPQVSG